MREIQRPVGVFDSGVGGISVLKALNALLPGELFIYFGDCANAPYGTKTPEEVLTHSENAVKMLLTKGAKAIVIACNTATAAAAKQLRMRYPDVPIIGMEPALKPAVLSAEHPRILVMATPMTLRLEKFKELEQRFKNTANISLLPCPGLVELIESGKWNCPETEELLRELLKDELKDPPDAIVLGCTHFPFVQRAISKVFGRDMRFFDGAEGTARQLRRQLYAYGLLNRENQNGGVIFKTSVKGNTNIELMKKLFYAPL